MLRRRKHLMLYALLPALSLLILGASDYHQRLKPCARVEVRLAPGTEQVPFLEAGDIREVIGADNQLIDAPIGQIGLEQIEQSLLETQYVEQADAFVAPDGTLGVEVALRKPIARFMNADGRNFYLDSRLRPMPLSPSFTARTLLVRGHCLEKVHLPLGDILYAPDGLLELIQALNADLVLSAQITEIALDAHGNATLYSEVGDLKIELGRPTDGPQKLHKLKLFYEQIAPQAGWDHYKSVSLAFKGQIVAWR